MERTQHKFTCGCVPFYIRNSIQEMSEMERSGIEVHLLDSADNYV